MAMNCPAATKADRLFQQRLVTEIDKSIHNVISKRHRMYSKPFYLQKHKIIEVISGDRSNLFVLNEAILNVSHLKNLGPL